MIKKIAVLVSGSGSNLQAIIDNKENYNGEIVLVISNKENAYGLERAKLAGINTAVISKDDTLILKTLKDNNVDFVVLAGYLAILTPIVINEYVNKIINIHPSLLPSFGGPGAYGIHVHEMAFNRGVKVSGATIHFVNDEVDGGPILLQESCDISMCKDASEIQMKVLEVEHRLLPKAVELLCK